MPFQIIRNDITKVEAEIIVNTANPKVCIGSGVDRAIYNAAGEEMLLEERKKIGEIRRGEAVYTPAFGLNAKYIIHTVGPVWEGGDQGEFEILRKCYKNSLELALTLGCESIAFPLISTGVYGFPKDKALQIAVNEISNFLLRSDVEMMVTMVVLGNKAFQLSKNLFFQVESFLEDEDILNLHHKEYGYRELELRQFRIRQQEEQKKQNFFSHSSVSKAFTQHTFDKAAYMSDGKDEHMFQDHLLQLIINSGMDNAIVYKKSNVTKNAFSKIMCGDTKVPKKSTVLGFCIGLGLSIQEAEELLASADMAFNPKSKRDRLVMQCIEMGQYNVDEINIMLYLCNQPLLGNIDNADKHIKAEGK